MKRFGRVSLCAFMLAMLCWSSPPPRAFADTCTWNGKNSNYWSDPGNWDGCPNGVPGPMDDVVIPGFTPPRLSSVDGNYTIGNLSLQGGYLTVFSTATLNGGTLTASGSSTMQNFNVINMNIILSDGTLSTNGGTFNGPLTIGLLATLRVVGGGANFTDNVTVNGTLADNNTGQTFAFGGSQFANNGTVSIPN
ncbi:MAG: hypothetical protein LC737_06055, partial [Chloroflexi bacterium]|nr:hypothetical protein [Chloroflexota bacterium]